MACPECKKEVSERALSCPQCGAPLPAGGRARRRASLMVAGAVGLAVVAGGAFLASERKSPYERVEELRAEQDGRGIHDEHVRQRFFRLYTEHPKDAVYAYLWARIVDDADKRDVLKRMIDHQLFDQPRPAPNGYTSFDSKEHMQNAAARYKGLFRGAIRSPERPDLQGIERTRLPDHKGPLAEAVRGFTVCANTYADACLRAYVPVDARFGSTWPRGDVDPGALKDNQVVGLAGAVVPNGRGENIMIADALTVEGS
jgi:hypothetical protein